MTSRWYLGYWKARRVAIKPFTGKEEISIESKSQVRPLLTYG
jgi:hypothetical protein